MRFWEDDHIHMGLGEIQPLKCDQASTSEYWGRTKAQLSLCVFSDKRALVVAKAEDAVKLMPEKDTDPLTRQTLGFARSPVINAAAGVRRKCWQASQKQMHRILERLMEP